MGNFYEDWKARNGYGSNPKTTDGPKQETPNKSDPKSSSNDFYENWKSRNGYALSYDRAAEYNRGANAFNSTMDLWRDWYERSRTGLDDVSWSTAKREAATNNESASILLNRIGASRKWANEYKDLLGEDYDKVMSSLQEATTATYWMDKGYKQTEDYYGNWDSQESYDADLKAAQEHDAMMAKDTEAMSRELDAMKKAYEAMAVLEGPYGLLANDAMPEDERLQHTLRYNFIKRRYGETAEEILPKIEALEKELAEASEYQGAIAEAQRVQGWEDKYSGMSYSDIKASLGQVEDEAERQYLESIAPSRMTDDDYASEIASVDEQITATLDHIDVLSARYTELDTAIANLSASSDPEDWRKLATAQNELDMVLTQLDSAKKDYDALMTRAWELDHARKYETLEDRADFTANSAPMDTEDAGIYHKLINSDLDRTEVVLATMALGETMAPLVTAMTQEERDRYNYLENTEGEGKQAAYEYLDYLKPTLNARGMDAGERLVGQISQDSFLGSLGMNALSVPFKLAGGLGYLDIASQNLWRDITGDYRPIDYNTPFMGPTRLSRAIRSGTAAGLTDQFGTIQLDPEEHPFLSTVLNGRGIADVYQLGMSAIDSRVAGLTGNPVAATALLSSSAATEGVLDALERGATDEEALEAGLWNGAFEAIFEFVEVDNLLKGDPSTVKAMVNQAITEGLGEGATSIANNIADAIIMADKSVLQLATAEYMQNENLSYEDAFRKAFIDMAVDIGWDAIGGGFSGSMSAGGKSLIQNYRADMASGRYVQENQMQDPLMQLAQSMAGVRPGKLDAYAQRAAAKPSTRNMGRLYNEVNRVVDRQNMDQLAQALEAQGLSRKDATHLATAIGLDINGIDLTKSQEKLLKQYEDSEKVMAAVKEVLGSTAFLERNARVRNLVATQKKAPTAAQAAPGQAKAAEQTAAPNAKIETTHEVSEDGKTHLIGEPDKAVSIRGIKSIENGKMMLELEDGSVVDSREVSYSSDGEALIYAVMADMNVNPHAANLLIRSYDLGGDIDASAFALGIREAYMFGQYNMPKAELDSRQYASVLSKAQLDTAYKMGQVFGGKDTARKEATVRKTRKAADKKAGEKKTGQVHFDRKGRTFNDTQETALKVMEQMSKALGVEFYVFESYVDDSGKRVYKSERGERKAPNGFYDPATGAIHIDLNAGIDGKGTMLFTVAHELTHFIRQWSPAKFKTLANFLFDYYGYKGQSVSKLVEGQIAKAKGNGRTIDWDTAYEEVVADSMETMLADGNVVQMMAELKQQDKGLWEKICDWFKDLVEDLKKLVGAYEGLKPDSPEGRMVADMQEMIAAFETLYAEALVEASENYRANEGNKKTTQEGGVKYSFAGIRSRTADKSAYMLAKEMQEQGVNNEKIRQATGWYQGMDGKWRYEIDDSRMEITKDVYTYMRLGDLMKHEELYDAYPDLADIDVVFQHLGEGVSGSYNSKFDSIDLDYRLKNDPEGIKDALAHELQHAIQGREGFTRGSTVAAWERKKKQGFDARRAEDIRKAQETERELRRLQEEEPVFYRDMLELDSMTPDVPRGEVDWETLEKIEDDPIEWQQYDARREELEAKYGDMKVWDANDLLYERKQAAKNMGRSATELYFDTAGEVEARDVTNRRRKTHEQRKAYPPRLGNEDTVFSDGQNRSDDFVPGTVSQKEIEENISSIARMDPVTAIRSDEFKMGDGKLLEDVTAFFNAIGGSVYNDRLGDVFLRKRGVRNDLGHGMSDEKATSFAAVPDVLRYGKVAGFVINKGGKGFDSATVVAPITIGEVPYMMGVIVHRSNGENRFYVHDVFAIKEEAAPLITGAQRMGESGGATSTISIIRKILDVKQKSAGATVDNSELLRSDRDPTAVATAQELEKQNAKLKEDVSYLRELVRLQGKVTDGKVFRKSSIEAAASVLLGNAKARGDKAELAKLLKVFYDNISGSEDISWESVIEAAQPAVDWLMEHEVVRKELDGFAQEVLREVRGSRFRLDDEQKQNAAYKYGSYNDYRKRMMGNAVVSDNANMTLDEWWHYMSGKFPSVFRPDVASTDMPEAFDEAMGKMRSMEVDDGTYGYTQEMKAYDLMLEVYNSYWDVSTLKTVADVKQKEINELKAIHAKRIETIRKDHRAAMDKLRAEHREALKEVRKKLREKALEDQQKIIDRAKEQRERTAENRKKTEMRMKIRKVIRDLDKLFSRGDKRKNVKEGMRDLAATALASAEVLFTENYGENDMIRNGITVDLSARESNLLNQAIDILAQLDNPPADPAGIEAWYEQEDALKQKLSRIKHQLKEVFERQRNKNDSTTVKELLQQLANSYADLMQSEDSYIRDAFDENVYKHLLTIMEGLGYAKAKDMRLDQLEALYDAYKMVLTTIRNANKLFAADVKETRDQLAARTMIEVSMAGRNQKRGKLAKAANSFAWNNLKPVYAFEKLGSETMQMLYGNIRKGQDTWALDMTEANEYRLETEKKYGADKWDMEKEYSFTNPNGKKFSLTLPQIMSIYAYSKRPHAYDHLMKGGIVFADNTMTTVTKAGIKFHMLKEDATAYRLSMDTLNEIIGTLNEQQIKYVDEMQEYLSSTMGEKGNSVSMKLYGITLFNEKNYFPLRSSEKYSKETREANFQKEQGQINLVNSGFAKALTPKASNAIVLDGFTDVWAEHVNDMSMYHSFVLPMEDFRKVYNYRTIPDGVSDSESVVAAIENAHGSGATAYIDQLYRDLNGGALTDPREGIAKALTGKFKKAAVMASLSVVLQQPSSIGRAFAEIDLKHFESFGLVRGVSRAVFKHKDHDRQWAELKRYAPVAMIKEMGYFDTGMGLTAKEYLQAKEYSGIMEKAKALFTDGKYRDELLGKAASVADELTWLEIWRAVKNETAARNPKMDKTSEEFLKIAGDRFSEVIDKTQVYDSVLARSANMRSKSLFMNMATSFMAEPTTTINMIEDALRKGAKGQKKYAARVMGAVFCSIVLNAALSSLVYAGRDDDEDETYLEKYLSRFLTEIIDGVNPLTYFPFLKDVWSIAQGFDVERADMSLVSDAIEVINKLDKLLEKDTSDMSDEEIKEHRKALAEGWMSAVDVVASLLGIPLKNARREVNGAVNLFGTLKEDFGGRKTTWGSLGDVLQRDIADTLPAWWRPDTESKSERLYDAIVRGDDAYVERIMSTYADKDKAEAAIRAVIKDRYIAGEVSKLDARQMLIDYGGVDVVKAHWTMDEWDYDKENTSEGGDDYGKYDRFFSAVETGAELKTVIKEYTANGVSEETLRKQITEHFKPLYVDMNTADRASLKGYLLNAMEACGQDREKAELNLMKWDFEAKYGYTWDDRGDAYRNGAITGTQLVNELMTISGKTREDAELSVEVYDWQKDIPNCEITASGVNDYHENCEAVGISRKTFYTAWRYYKDTSGDMDEETGEPIPYSKVRKVLPYIGGLDLTPEQKTALALCWWPASTVRQYKTW